MKRFEDYGWVIEVDSNESCLELLTLLDIFSSRHGRRLFVNTGRDFILESATVGLYW